MAIIADGTVEVSRTAGATGQVGTDQCCGSESSQKIGSATAALAMEECSTGSETIEEATRDATQSKDWETSSLFELASYIVNRHHVFTRNELDRLEPLLSRVAATHSQNHPELSIVEDLFADFKQELSGHMLKEERVLFPYLVEMEEAVKMGAVNPPPFFGTVRNPLQVMMLEHDRSAQLMKAIREGSSDFKVPADGCSSYHALYEGLEALEADLHQHIQFENDILFRRAIAIESL